LNTQTYRDAILAAEKVQRLLESFQNKSPDQLRIESLATDLSDYKQATEQVYNLVTAMKNMFAKTVAGNSLTEAQLSVWRGQFDGYQAKAQGSIASITAQINAISSFLSSYQQGQESIVKSIESFKSQIALTEKQLTDAQFNTQLGKERTEIAGESSTKTADLGVQSAKTTVDYLTNTKGTTLDSINNQLKSAQVSYAEIANNAEKFNSKSPVQGVIADMLVDPGQDVNPGTPLYKVVSDQQEIEITVNTDELKLVDIGNSVKVKGEQGEVSGRVVSRSAVADKNGNFKIIIGLDADTLKIGTFADVMITTSQSGLGVPVNAVRIVDNGIGEIFLWN
jgi:multidrug resistance efflux pump